MASELVLKFGDNVATRVRDFTDGPSNTILAVICGDSLAAPWTRPVDLPIDLETPQSSLGNPKEYAVIMADGAVRILTRNVTDELLRALLTRSGSEDLEKLQPE